jgi:hypothetical protein
MFEQLERRVRMAAEARVAERTAALAQQLRDLLPRDIDVEASGDGVLLTGRGLGQQLVLDASQRWTIAGLLK